MTTSITPNPAIHDTSPQDTQNEANAAVAQLKSLFTQLPQMILSGVVAFIKQETGIDLSGFLTLVNGLNSALGMLSPLQDFLPDLESALGGIDLSSPGSILAAIESGGGALLDALWNGLTGNTTGTGKEISDVLAALEAQFENITGIGTNASSAVAQLEALISTTVGTAQTDINDVGAAISTAASNAESVINGIVSALTGALGSAFTPEQATQALQGTAATTAANSAAVAALQTAVAGTTNGGLAVTVNFGDYANSTTLPAIFTTTWPLGTSAVTMGITSGCAALQWLASVTSPYQANAVYNVAATDTDYQLISGTFPSGPSNPYTAVSGANVLIGRANLAGTTYVWAELGYNVVGLGCSVNGTSTTFTTATYTFQAGATYSLVCGTTGNVRTFEVLCNGAVIPGMTWTDTSTSLLGAGYRYGGFADYGWSYPGYFSTPGTWPLGACIPGTMSQWNILDNTTTDGVTQVAYGGTGVASLSGLVKGNGTAPFTAAVPGVDYSVPGTGPRVTSMTSAAIPAFSTDTTDLLTITALTTAITSMTTYMTGTLHDGQKLMVRIHSASALAIAWGTSFQSSGVATLPTTTVAGKTITVGLQYDAVVAKLVCLAVDAVGY